MPQKSGIAIGNHQVSLTLFDLNSACQFRRPRSSRIHNDLASDLQTIGRSDPPLPNLGDRRAQLKLPPVFLRALHQEPRRARRIQYRILRNEEAAPPAIPPTGLQAPPTLRAG